MTWEFVIILQVFVSSLMALFSRKLALSDRKLFYLIGVFSYAAVALMGIVYSIAFAGGNLPDIPHGDVWIYLLIEGICIPGSWLLFYKIIGIFGASNAVVIASANTIAVAAVGVIFLGEPLTTTFIVGSLLLLSGVYTAFLIQSDTKHHKSVPISTKIAVVVGMIILFSVGMFCEKKAISIIGVWDYAAFGWGMQFVGALLLCLIYGRKELVNVSRKGVIKGLLLGTITSISGGLYIYALSIGSLSHTIVATSGRLGVTMFLAALLLGERNQWKLRVVAFGLSSLGLFVLFSNWSL